MRLTLCSHTMYYIETSHKGCLILYILMMNSLEFYEYDIAQKESFERNKRDILLSYQSNQTPLNKPDGASWPVFLIAPSSQVHSQGNQFVLSQTNLVQAFLLVLIWLVGFVSSSCHFDQLIRFTLQPDSPSRTHQITHVYAPIQRSVGSLWLSALPRGTPMCNRRKLDSSQQLSNCKTTTLPTCSTLSVG